MPDVKLRIQWWLHECPNMVGVTWCNPTNVLKSTRVQLVAQDWRHRWDRFGGNGYWISHLVNGLFFREKLTRKPSIFPFRMALSGFIFFNKTNPLNQVAKRCLWCFPKSWVTQIIVMDDQCWKLWLWGSGYNGDTMMPTIWRLNGDVMGLYVVKKMLETIPKSKW